MELRKSQMRFGSLKSKIHYAMYQARELLDTHHQMQEHLMDDCDDEGECNCETLDNYDFKLLFKKQEVHVASIMLDEMLDNENKFKSKEIKNATLELLRDCAEYAKKDTPFTAMFFDNLIAEIGVSSDIDKNDNVVSLRKLH